MGESTATRMAGAGIWLTLTLASLAHASGALIPDPIVVVCAAVAAPIALAVAGHTIASFWRGPTIHSFRRDDSELLSPDEAAHVRLTSQLRGTMGGAGFLYPRRLAFPALAWIVAAIEGIALVSRASAGEGSFALVGAAVAAALTAFLFPPRPYYYLEATGGAAVVAPPSVAYRLRQRAIIANAIAQGEPVDVTTPAPTPLPTGLRAERTTSRDPVA